MDAQDRHPGRTPPGDLYPACDVQMVKSSDQVESWVWVATYHTWGVHGVHAHVGGEVWICLKDTMHASYLGMPK